MAPKELPSFFLYSIGYSPRVLTLGTLVYDNYGSPETRSATFPKLSDQQFKDLEAQNQIISQPVSGCFIHNKHSKYGLGIGFAELATLDFEYARQSKRLVEAKDGTRVLLRDPDAFFDHVLKDPQILDKLTLWLTAAKSSWLFHKTTFRRPRVYCLTGYYELSKVSARISHEWMASSGVGLSPAVVGVASGVPIGGNIGPFKNGQTLEANVRMPEAAIWAARFHELKVEYVQIATQGKTKVPSIIKLRDDCTHPRGGLMGGQPTVSQTRVVVEGDEINRAQGAVATLTVAEEMPDETVDAEYWKAFGNAERRLADDGEDSTDAKDDAEEL